MEVAKTYENKYTEKLNGKENIKRYIMAYNSNSTSNVVSAEVNLNSSVQETIPVEIQDTVELNMNLSGSGRYDIRIKDSLDNIIREDINKLGTSGLNIYTWNGNDDLGNVVSDGDYQLEITPYIECKR